MNEEVIFGIGGMDIRQEADKDYKRTEELVEKAFLNARYTDHKEHLLVAKLRESDTFVLELSLVAEIAGEIVGHLMLTKVLIKNDAKEAVSLALGPVSVLPELQNKGIGSQLILASLPIARKLGYTSVILLGHADYYPRFGFKPASLWGIKAPFAVPDEAFMALELENDSLKDVSGTVVHAKEFFE